jgi:hypothetical protein
VGVKESSLTKATHGKLTQAGHALAHFCIPIESGYRSQNEKLVASQWPVSATPDDRAQLFTHN